MVEPSEVPEVAGTEIGERVRAGLDAGEIADDDTRLKILDELYEALEAELDRDLDQAGPSRR